MVYIPKSYLPSLSPQYAQQELLSSPQSQLYPKRIRSDPSSAYLSHSATKDDQPLHERDRLVNNRDEYHKDNCTTLSFTSENSKQDSFVFANKGISQSHIVLNLSNEFLTESKANEVLNAHVSDGHSDVTSSASSLKSSGKRGSENNEKSMVKCLKLMDKPNICSQESRQSENLYTKKGDMRLVFYDRQANSPDKNSSAIIFNTDQKEISDHEHKHTIINSPRSNDGIHSKSSTSVRAEMYVNDELQVINRKQKTNSSCDEACIFGELVAEKIRMLSQLLPADRVEDVQDEILKLSELLERQIKLFC